MRVLRGLAALVFMIGLAPLSAQEEAIPPVIDMHLHGPMGGDPVEPIDPWLEVLAEHNVRKALVMPFPEDLESWVPEAPDLFVPSLTMPCPTQMGVSCFPDGVELPDLDWLREELQSGRIRALGEVISELFGIYPTDPVLEPYFALAEEFDVPFALHMGPGPAWAVQSTSIYEQFPEFEAAAGNPLELEELLRRHPDLRLFVMHAGWPMGDEMLAILWHHPNVYVGVGHLQTAISRSEYYSYLKRLVEAGFADRIMFGSDVGLNEYGEGIDAILDAEFLTEEHKRAILYDNAARFLRLDERPRN